MFMKYATATLLAVKAPNTCNGCAHDQCKLGVCASTIQDKFSTILTLYKQSQLVASKVTPDQFTKNFRRSLTTVGYNVKTASGDKRIAPIKGDFLYGRAMAVHGDDSNNNGDLFEWGSKEDRDSPELLRFDPKLGKYVYQTFIGKGFYKDHKNDSVTYSKGILLDSVANHARKGIEVLFAVDKKKDEDLARGIEQGYITDVSMGCRVGFSICSICGNQATNEEQYCTHVKLHKAGLFSGKETGWVSKPVYEINRNVEFIELSAVTTGADSRAKIIEKVARQLADGQDLISIGRELIALGEDLKLSKARVSELLKKAAELAGKV